MKTLSHFIGIIFTILSLAIFSLIAPASVSIAFIDDKLLYGSATATVVYLSIRRRIPSGFGIAAPLGILMASLVLTNIITVWGQRTRSVPVGDFGQYSVEAITTGDLARYARETQKIASSLITPYQLRRAVYDPRRGRIFIGVTGGFINLYIDLDGQRGHFARFGGTVSPYHLFEGRRKCIGDIPDSEGEHNLDTDTDSLFSIGNRECDGVHERYIVRLNPGTLSPTGRTVPIPIPIRILGAQDGKHIVVIDETAAVSLVDIRSMGSRIIVPASQMAYDGTVFAGTLYVTFAGAPPLQFSHKADILAVDLATGRSRSISISGRPLGGIATLTHGKILAFVEYFGDRIIFYDPVSGRIDRSQIFAKGLRPVVADNDRGVIYTGSHITGDFYRYDPAQARVTGRIFLGAGIRGICPLPDGNVVVTSSQGIFLVRWHDTSI